MVKIDDFFISANEISNISEEAYQKVNFFIDAFEAISQATYQSLYIIDYNNKNFLYVSDNPLFLCGHTPEKVKSLGYTFYIEHVPEEEQYMLIEINKAGFDFFNKTAIHERMKYTISYNFHLLNKKKKTLINHKITPIQLTDDGRVWLAACVVSLASCGQFDCIEIRKKNETVFWKYSLEEGCWREKESVVLNEKEKSILSLSYQGYTMNEIAETICLSINAIKFYRQKLFKKLDVKNITEAIAFAANHRLI